MQIELNEDEMVTIHTALSIAKLQASRTGHGIDGLLNPNRHYDIYVKPYDDLAKKIKDSLDLLRTAN